MQKFEILLSLSAKCQNFSYFYLILGQRGVGRSNLVLFDLTRRTNLPRVSFESSALHHINYEVTFACSALKNQNTSEPDPCK